MPKTSAGIALYRRRAELLELFLVHPGGPFWAKKDLGAWSFPKGEYSADEDALDSAKREFEEETGSSVDGEFIDLGTAKQASGKVIHIWAVEGDFDPVNIRSNTFSMEWPPKSGKLENFPEVDRAGWFGIVEAKAKLIPGQTPFLDVLCSSLSVDPGTQVIGPSQTTRDQGTLF